MYSKKTGLLLAFHGCEKSVRDAIVSGTIKMRPSQNGYDWLGIGLYFWEDNYERALDFAKNPPGKKVIKDPAVLGAVLDLQFCLDLLNTAYLKTVRDSYDNFAASAETLGKELPLNKSVKGSKDSLLRELDCAVVENVHYQRGIDGLTLFDSARGVFIEGNELYPSAGFKDKNHIQICIRNPNCIKGFFIPRQEEKWP